MFSGDFLISINLPTTDLECLIRNLIFNLLKFKSIAFKQCPPLLAIPIIWNHLVYKGVSYSQERTVPVHLVHFAVQLQPFVIGASEISNSPKI